MEQLIGASAWEQEIYDHLVSHEENERALLEAYQEEAQSSTSKAFQYLTSLIIEDEIRHHRIFAELASSFKNESELGGAEPAVPRLEHWGPAPTRVVALSEKLLEREYADSKELRVLSSQLKSAKDNTLWQLLVRLMEMDTAKHIEILKFAKAHAEKSIN